MEQEKDFWAIAKLPETCAVVKVTAQRTKQNGISTIVKKEVIEGDDSYSHATSPFFRQIYENVQKQREEQK